MVSIRRLFQRQRVILTDWAPALQGLPIDDSRMQLAAILTGLQLAPLLLIKYTPEVVAIFGEAVQCINVGLLPSIAHQDRHAIRIDGSQAELSRAASDPGSNGGMIENSNARPAQDRLGPASERGANRRDRVDSPSAPWVASSLVSRSDDRQQEHPARLLRASRQSTQKPPQEKIPRPTVEQPTQGLSSEPVMKFGIESTLLNQGFITSFGGFFYLINALNRAMSLQKDLLERLQAYDCPSAWLWLYGFGRSFRLDFDSSLLRFIARQCGFENLHLLLQQQSLPLVQMLFHQLCKIYGKEIWNQNLLQVSASVVSTPSHIDVFYPLATVRLDVRLAGLDINPAWVPWLGRVVTFHYREQMPGAATQPVPRE
jgi:hypothetical protein